MRVHYMGYILLVPFGLSPWLPPLQRPIRHYFSLLLDFLRGSLRFNVQSTSLSRSFGLQPVSQPLQRPIRLSFSFLLDFNLPSLCFNVQSATAFLFFYIYIRIPLSKSLTLHPYFPQFSHLLPTTKNSRRDKPCGSNHTLYSSCILNYL